MKSFVCGCARLVSCQRVPNPAAEKGDMTMTDFKKKPAPNLLDKRHSCLFGFVNIRGISACVYHFSPPTSFLTTINLVVWCLLNLFIVVRYGMSNVYTLVFLQETCFLLTRKKTRFTNYANNKSYGIKDTYILFLVIYFQLSIKKYYNK